MVRSMNRVQFHEFKKSHLGMIARSRTPFSKGGGVKFQKK